MNKRSDYLDVWLRNSIFTAFSLFPHTFVSNLSSVNWDWERMIRNFLIVLLFLPLHLWFLLSRSHIVPNLDQPQFSNLQSCVAIYFLPSLTLILDFLASSPQVRIYQQRKIGDNLVNISHFFLRSFHPSSLTSVLICFLSSSIKL